MMRRVLALVLMSAISLSALADGPPAPKKTIGHKRLQEMRTTPDKWDDLMSAEPMPDDKPARPQYQAPAPVKKPVPARTPAAQSAATVQPAPAARQATAATATRSPASIPPMAARVAPQPKIFPVANITFDDYVAENARNPALSTKINDHQTAFADTSGPAVISIPGSESSTAAAAPSAPATGGAAGSQSAAIQAAAAAAGITLPAGTGSTTTPAAPAAGGPVR